MTAPRARYLNRQSKIPLAKRAPSRQDSLQEKASSAQNESTKNDRALTLQSRAVEKLGPAVDWNCTQSHGNQDAMHCNDQGAIANEYPVLFRYLGEVRFAACLRDCLLQWPKPKPTWKQVADALPERLATSPVVTPEIAELALMEQAMRKAFEANEPAKNARSKLHPSVSLLSFQYNTTSLWAALMCDEPPPRPYRLDQLQHVLTWRHKGQARMRLLGEEEFLCMVSLTPRQNTVTPEQIAMPFYVAGWLDSDVVLEATTPAEK